MERLPPRYVAALAVAVAAFAAAAVWSALTPTTYRAETAIVVGVGDGPLRPGAPGSSARLARSLDDLVASNLIASDVVTNLRLSTTPSALLRRISVATPEGGLLRVRVQDGDRVRAEAVAQELGLVFTRLVRLRFGGSTPPLRATVWDPAHPAGVRAPDWGRNLGIAAALAASALAAAWLAGRLRGRPEPSGGRHAFARNRLSPAPREAAPVAASAQVEVRDSLLLTSGVAAASDREPAPERPADRPWTLARLERLVGRFGDAYAPERVDEWRLYVLYLREYADVDGRLPKTFDGLVRETFGDLLEREQATAGAST